MDFREPLSRFSKRNNSRDPSSAKRRWNGSWLSKSISSVCTFALEATEISHLQNYICSKDEPRRKKLHKHTKRRTLWGIKSARTADAAGNFCINFAQLNDFSSVSLNSFFLAELKMFFAARAALVIALNTVSLLPINHSCGISQRGEF